MWASRPRLAQDGRVRPSHAFPLTGSLRYVQSGSAFVASLHLRSGRALAAPHDLSGGPFVGSAEASRRTDRGGPVDVLAGVPPGRRAVQRGLLLGGARVMGGALA